MPRRRGATWISLSTAESPGLAGEPLKKKSAEARSKNAQRGIFLGCFAVYQVTTRKSAIKNRVAVRAGNHEAYQRAVELDPTGKMCANRLSMGSNRFHN